MRGLHVEHGPAAVRREFDDFDRVPSHWIRAAMAGCQRCAEWRASRDRLSGLHRAYRRRRTASR